MEVSGENSMSLDYAFLADIMCETKEQQSLVHYAVRGSAMEVLSFLLDKLGTYYNRFIITYSINTQGKYAYECRDYFERTPLQLAAELGKYSMPCCCTCTATLNRSVSSCEVSIVT